MLYLCQGKAHWSTKKPNTGEQISHHHHHLDPFLKQARHTHCYQTCLKAVKTRSTENADTLTEGQPVAGCSSESDEILSWVHNCRGLSPLQDPLILIPTFRRAFPRHSAAAAACASIHTLACLKEYGYHMRTLSGGPAQQLPHRQIDSRRRAPRASCEASCACHMAVTCALGFETNTSAAVQNCRPASATRMWSACGFKSASPTTTSNPHHCQQQQQRRFRCNDAAASWYQTRPCLGPTQTPQH